MIRNEMELWLFILFVAFTVYQIVVSVRHDLEMERIWDGFAEDARNRFFHNK